MPWKWSTEKEVAFLMPWKWSTEKEVAFLMPWKWSTEKEVAFLMPWKSSTKEDLALLLARKLSEVQIYDSGFEQFAMLPLGAESGRHIRSGDERNAGVDAMREKTLKPVAHLDGSYAMLPLGTETGRHIRNLNENDRQPEKSVATNAPSATA
jgi:hypothetical protein